MSTNNAVNSNVSGNIVQQVRKQSASATSTTNGIANTTTPTTSNTILLDSITMTPLSALNTLSFEFCSPISAAGTNFDVGFFLFQGSTLLSTSVNYGAAQGDPDSFPGLIYFNYEQVSGVNVSTTYSIYYSIVGSGTAYINQTPSGYTFGSSMIYSFLITEIAV